MLSAWPPWHTFPVSCWNHWPLLYCLPYLPFINLNLTFWYFSGLVLSFRCSCIPSPRETAFHPEVQFQTSLSLSQICTFSPYLFSEPDFVFIFLFFFSFPIYVLAWQCHSTISQVFETSHSQRDFWFSNLLLHDLPQFPVAPILIPAFLPIVHSNSARSKDSTSKYILNLTMPA